MMNCGCLIFFIAEAQVAGSDVDWDAMARGAADIMTTVPLRKAGDTFDYKISAKVHAALAEALGTPGISLAELIRIRKMIRTL
jgi:Xaa-Pro aminopeptidase